MQPLLMGNIRTIKGFYKGMLWEHQRIVHNAFIVWRVWFTGSQFSAVQPQLHPCSFHRHPHTDTTRFICHRQSPYPTYHHSSHSHQCPNGHGVRTFLLDGRLYRRLQPNRCRPPSPPTIRTHTTYQCFSMKIRLVRQW